MTAEQRNCEDALARLQRALAGEPKPHKPCNVVDELFRNFGMDVKCKEVRDEQV